MNRPEPEKIVLIRMFFGNFYEIIYYKMYIYIDRHPSGQKLVKLVQ